MIFISTLLHIQSYVHHYVNITLEHHNNQRGDLKFGSLPERYTSTEAIQWNPSCEATPFASEKWPFKRGDLSSGVKINTFMLRYTL